MIFRERLRTWKLWPRTLASQLIVVTALAVALSNGVVVAWFTLGHESDRDEAMVERLLDRAVATAALMRQIPQNAREAALRAFSGNFWGTFELHRGKFDVPKMNAEEIRLATRVKALLPEAMEKLPVSVRVSQARLGQDTRPQPEPPGGGGPEGPPTPRPGDRMFEVTIPVAVDYQLVATFFRPPAPFWSSQLLLAGFITAFVASLAATFIARRVARPLSKLAEAASLVARGGEAPKVPEEGPDDVRNAATAFNAMYDQVTRTMDSQRHLLSAVGHDLRTPITAMRINIEFVQDAELAERLAANLDELQALTEAVLSAARGAGGEKSRQIDLSALTESVCADLSDLDIPANWCGGEQAPLMCRPNELKRALRNLIQNAVAYGKKADVSLHTEENAYHILIDDDGPGIPPQDRTRVFEPFVRLESSRNADTGGVGLGLTLAQAIAENHGGAIHLEDREGGFRVRVSLPKR